jgi:hypothetical protein
MKTKVTVEWAKSEAERLKAKYPHLDDAQKVVDRAVLDGELTEPNEILIVWGRLMRLFR